MTYGWYIEFVRPDGSGKSVLVRRDDDIRLPKQAERLAAEEHGFDRNDFFMSRSLSEDRYNRIARRFRDRTFSPDEVLGG